MIEMGKEGFNSTLCICDWHFPVLMMQMLKKSVLPKKTMKKTIQNPSPTSKNYCIFQDVTKYTSSIA